MISLIPHRPMIYNNNVKKVFRIHTMQRNGKQEIHVKERVKEATAITE